MGTFRKPKKSTTEKRADLIGELAKQISIPRSALTGEKEATKTLLNDANVMRMESLPSIPFEECDPFKQTNFKNKIDAKTAIAEYLGRPLARLTSAQMEKINHILNETLDKKAVLAQVRTYFTLSLQDRPGDESCTGK